jgi:hypothetical protein
MAQVLVLAVSLILSCAAGAIEAKDPLSGLSAGSKLVAASDITFLANFDSVSFGPQPLLCRLYVSKQSPKERVLKKGSILVVNRVEKDGYFRSEFGNTIHVSFEHPEVVGMTCGWKLGWPTFGQLQETLQGKFEIDPFPADVM